MYEPETATLHLKVFLSDRRRLTVVSKLEKLFFVLNVSVIACLMGQALQSSPLPQPLFRELTQLSGILGVCNCVIVRFLHDKVPVDNKDVGLYVL